MGQSIHELNTPQTSATISKTVKKITKLALILGIINNINVKVSLGALSKNVMGIEL